MKHLYDEFLPDDILKDKFIDRMSKQRNSFSSRNKLLYRQIAVYAACVLLCSLVIIPMTFNFGSDISPSDSQMAAASQMTSTSADNTSSDIIESSQAPGDDAIPQVLSLIYSEELCQGVYKESYDFELYFDSFIHNKNYTVAEKNNKRYYYSYCNDTFKLAKCQRAYKIINYNGKAYKIETDYININGDYYVNSSSYNAPDDSAYGNCVISAIPHHEGLLLVQLYLNAATYIVFYDINTDTVYEWLKDYKDKITSSYTNEESVKNFISPDGSKIFFSFYRDDLGKSIEYYYDFNNKQTFSTDIESYPLDSDSFARNSGFIKWIDNDFILYSKIHNGILSETGGETKVYSSESTYDLICKNITTGEEFTILSDVGANIKKDYGENGSKYYISYNNIFNLISGDIEFTLDYQPVSADCFATMRTSPDGRFILVNIWKSDEHTFEAIVDIYLKEQILTVDDLPENYSVYGPWISYDIIARKNEIIKLKGPFREVTVPVNKLYFDETVYLSIGRIESELLADNVSLLALYPDGKAYLDANCVEYFDYFNVYYTLTENDQIYIYNNEIVLYVLTKESDTLFSVKDSRLESKAMFIDKENYDVISKKHDTFNSLTTNSPRIDILPEDKRIKIVYTDSIDKYSIDYYSFEIDSTRKDVINKLNSYKSNLSSKTPADDLRTECNNMCWIVYPDGKIIGLPRDDTNYGSFGDKYSFHGNDVALPAGMSDYVFTIINDYKNR